MHEELSGEDGELLEERRELERQEEQLQKEVVSPLSCVCQSVSMCLAFKYKLARVYLKITYTVYYVL